MPDLEPVSGDPFASQLQPVSGDPFAEVNGMRNETGWMTEPTFQERWEGLPRETQQAIDELSTKEWLENFLHPRNQEMAIQYLLRNKNKPPAGWAANQLPQFSPSMDRRTVGFREYDTTHQNTDPRYPSLLWQQPSPYPNVSSKRPMPVPFDPDRPEVYDYRISDESDMTHWPPQPAQPYMHPNVPAAANAVAGFASGGLQGAGVPLPDWAASNPVQRALQNPDNQVAIEALAKTPFNKQGQLGKFQLEDLHKDFQAGLNNQQIANKYNVTKEAIQQRREQLGYPQKPRGRPWPSRLEPVSHDPFADLMPLSSDQETVTAHAVRVGGKIYTSDTHLNAYNKALKEHGGIDPGGSQRNLFQTSSGRIVNHKEAINLSRNALGLDLPEQ